MVWWKTHEVHMPEIRTGWGLASTGRFRSADGRLKFIRTESSRGLIRNNVLECVWYAHTFPRTSTSHLDGT